MDPRCPANPRWRGAAMIDAEAARARREHPENLDKRDLLLAELSTPLSATSKQNCLARIALIEQALAADPDYINALREKAKLYAFLVAEGFSSNPSADLSTALKAADRVLQLAPNDVTALGRKARVLYWQGDLGRISDAASQGDRRSAQGWVAARFTDPDISRSGSPRVDGAYWTAMFIAGVLGTVAGDLIHHNIGLYNASAA